MSPPQPAVSLPDLFRMFLKVGLSFGAGTGMSAVLQGELVNKRQAMPRGEFMALFGLARIVPSGSMTALTVAIGYRFQRLPGTVVALAAMILPSLTLTLIFTIAYTLLASGPALTVISLTLVPAAVAVVVVAAYTLGQEFLTPSVELLLMFASAASVVVFGVNPALVLIAGGLIGAVTIRHGDDDRK